MTIENTPLVQTVMTQPRAEGDLHVQDNTPTDTIAGATGFSIEMLPESLQQFAPLSDRQVRFITDFQRVTNSTEWPSVHAMRSLEVTDARTDFVQRRREVLSAASSISIIGVIKACQRRRTNRQYI